MSLSREHYACQVFYILKRICNHQILAGGIVNFEMTKMFISLKNKGKLGLHKDYNYLCIKQSEHYGKTS